MSIKLEHVHYEMYGRVRFFKADRCMNNEFMRAFNKYKINAKEIVSLDCGLLDLEEIEYSGELYETEQILLVIIRPDIERVDKHILPNIENFEFCGYDLVEMETYISAITNGEARFDKAIDYENLNKFGLISNYLDAVKMQILLRNWYSNESHAHCELVEIWRKLIEVTI